MPRARNIKPAFFENEFLSDLPPETRLLFIGLWCLADREGRLEDRPRGIKGRLFPFDDFDIDRMLQQLADSPDHFIIRYQVGGNAYIQVTNFSKHQNPHCKEHESTIPAPGEHQKSTVQSLCKNDISTEQARLIPDSLILIPDPLTYEAGNPPSDARFDEFYEAYPLHKGKRDAQRAFTKAIKSASLETMLEAIKKQKQSSDWLRENGRFIPHPATWLNRGQWDDETESSPSMEDSGKDLSRKENWGWGNE